MSVQYIEIGGEKMAVLPEAEFRRMAELGEDIADIIAAMRAEGRHLAGEEYVPHELVARLVNGENPLRVWRKHRGLSQQELADRVGLHKVTISGLELGRRDTSSRNWRLLAEALHVDLDDLIPLA